jgi:hypothetical protein
MGALGDINDRTRVVLPFELGFGNRVAKDAFVLGIGDVKEVIGIIVGDDGGDSFPISLVVIASWGIAS